MATIKNISSLTSPQSFSTDSIKGPLSSKSAKSVASAVNTPAQIPVPTPVNQDLFTSIIDNTKTTLQATGRIVTTAAAQARSDKENGKSIIGGMREFTGTVNDLISLITNHAQSMGYSKAQQEKLTATELGQVAQDYAYLSARGLLVDGASSLTGESASALNQQSTLELVLDNFGLGSAENPRAIPPSLAGGAAAGGAGTGTGSALAAGASTSSQILGAVGAAYGAVQVLANWGNNDPVNGAISGFTAGAYLGGAAFGPFGAAVGGVIGGIVGLASGLFKKSGKSQDQLARDQVRKLMQNQGMLNENWELTLANGVLYDIGKDGKFKLNNLDGSTRRAYEVDLKNPLAAETIALVQPLSFLITGGDTKLANQFAGYLTNAALSNAKDIEGARLNAVAILESMKVAPDELAQAIAAIVKQGAIPEATGRAYLEGLARLVTPSSEKVAAEKASMKGKKAA